MTTRHKEDKLGGVVEAALNRAMNDEAWIRDMVYDPQIEQNDSLAVYHALEDYLTEHLARIDNGA